MRMPGTEYHAPHFMAAGSDLERITVPLRARTILLVEDDRLTAHDLSRMMQDAGAHVVGPAYRLSDGLHIARWTALDAAVLDYRLHRKNSLPIAHELAQRGVPYLFQTGEPGRLLGMHLGVPILGKPFGASH